MFHFLPSSAWADWNLAEVAVQLGKIVEHPNQSQPNPGLRADESPCTRMRMWRTRGCGGRRILEDPQSLRDGRRVLDGLRVLDGRSVLAKGAAYIVVNVN